MISDNELYSLAIFLGSLSMLLIVLYHFLEVNADKDASSATSFASRNPSISSAMSAQDQKLRQGSVQQDQKSRQGSVQQGEVEQNSLTATTPGGSRKGSRVGKS